MGEDLNRARRDSGRVDDNGEGRPTAGGCGDGGSVAATAAGGTHTREHTTVRQWNNHTYPTLSTQRQLKYPKYPKRTWGNRPSES